MPALTHSPADVTAQLLVDLGVGEAHDSGENWSTFEGQEPDTPDDCLTVYLAAGVLHGRQQHGEEVESHGVQIRVRSRTQGQGFKKAHEVRTALAESVAGAQVTMAADADAALAAATYRVHCYSEVGSVLAIGKDGASGRFLHTINALVTLKQLS